MQECTTVFYFTGKGQQSKRKWKTITKMNGKHIIENLSLSFIVIAREQVCTESRQGRLAREHVITEARKTHWHMSMQARKARWHMSM